MQLISSFLYDLTVLKSAELASWWTLLHRHTAPSPLSFNWAHKTISPWWKCQPNVQWQRKGVQDLLPQIGIFKNVLFISKSWTFWIQKSSPCILSSWECLRGKSLLSSPNDSWHTQGREGEKCSCFSYSALNIFTRYALLQSKLLKCYNLLPLPLCCPPPVWSKNFGHVFCYLICRCHVRVLKSYFDLIL